MSDRGQREVSDPAGPSGLGVYIIPLILTSFIVNFRGVHYYKTFLFQICFIIGELGRIFTPEWILGLDLKKDPTNLTQLT